MTVRLEPEQGELLRKMVSRYREQRGPFLIAQMMGGRTIIQNGAGEVEGHEYYDVMALAEAGFLRIVSRDDRGGIQTVVPTVDGLDFVELDAHQSPPAKPAPEDGAPLWVIVDPALRTNAVRSVQQSRRQIAALEEGITSSEVKVLLAKIIAMLEDIEALITSQMPNLAGREEGVKKARGLTVLTRGMIAATIALSTAISGVADTPQAVENLQATAAHMEQLDEAIPWPGLPISPVRDDAETADN